MRFVYRHAGAHGIFVDLSTYGSAGCWDDNCRPVMDKYLASLNWAFAMLGVGLSSLGGIKTTNTLEVVFSAAWNTVLVAFRSLMTYATLISSITTVAGLHFGQDFGVCARACQQTQECTHWSFGALAGSTTCFLRKSDGGLEAESSFISGTKACAPSALSDASVAWKSATLSALRACDAGRSEDCPDLRIAADTDAFSEQFSEENFPLVAHNNRLLFSALEGAGERFRG
ncbi:hypothetical protein AK812_SmicGene1484 [Symbiodinium microadriaticum]|uniref:Apple domain-containing protein n=1 Tax=Symbiodinium microadriaticum TaxID=2951 RepID=A0A1Q9F3Y6_SYMMI|nr:hypothetical protein AK812_SmicGene1484 [Symbiodinium microadriaticum]